MISWHIVTSDVYAAGVKVESDLYFLSDTKEIYRGSNSFTESVILYTELPTTGIAHNRLYINSTTLEGKIHNGTDWVTVIKPVDSTVTTDGTNPVSGAAVATYVTNALANLATSDNVVTAVSWDKDEHILAVTKGESNTSNIVLDGVGVSLSYTSADGKLQLLDASGNAVGTAINLALDKFVHSGIYDAENKKIILYFDEEKSDSVEIPVGDLVDTYTAEGDGKGLELSVENNVVKGSIKLSTESDNIITADEKGLYAKHQDVSGKMDKDADAVKDNIAVFDENGNAIDSGKSFTDIASNAHVYVGTTFEEATTGITPVANDVVIVRTQIGESDKYQRRCYIYDGSAWQQMDENYDAENVYFASDIMTTSAIGNITLTNGQATIAAAGKNLKQVWDTIFIKEKNPTITQPAVTVTLNEAKAYEVGTTVTPNYVASLSAGKYEFNGSAGITASSWEISDTAGHTANTNTGAFDAFTVEDATNYSITAKANYEDSSIIPVTNTGNPYPSGQIKAGSKQSTSKAITGYRQAFYGILKAKDEVTSDVIRGLKGTVASPKAGNTFNIPIEVGTLRVVFAYPATIRDVNSVLDVNGLNAEIKTGFTMSQIDVEGANNYTAIPYKVYVLDYAEAKADTNTYKVTL